MNRLRDRIAAVIFVALVIASTVGITWLWFVPSSMMRLVTLSCAATATGMAMTAAVAASSRWRMMGSPSLPHSYADDGVRATFLGTV